MKLATYSLEIRYGLLAVILIGFTVWLAENALATIYADLDDILAQLDDAGAFWLFIFAIFSNAIPIIHVPYNLPLIPAAIHAENIVAPCIVGAAVGLGAGIGEVIAYTVSHRLYQRYNNRPAASPWLHRVSQSHPKFIPLILFLSAALPAPDGLVIVSMAMLQYPVRRFALPILLGKLAHNVGYSLLAYYLGELFIRSPNDEKRLQVHLSISIFIIFVVTIFYQFEKNRVLPAP